MRRPPWPPSKHVVSDTAQGPDWWRASDGRWYPPQSRAPTPPPPPPSSDVQITPDWWLASDGRWYPPRTERAATAPVQFVPQSSTAPTVSKGLSGTLQGFLWAVGALSAVLAVLSLVGLAAFNRYWEARPGSLAEAEADDDLDAVDSAINNLGGLAGTVGLVIFILMVIWSYQTHRATQILCRGTRSWSPGWSIGGWFIPFANVVIPKLVLNETEKIALAPRTGGMVGEDWRKRSTSVAGWLWWILFVAGTTVFLYGYGAFDDPGGTASSWRVGYCLTAAGSAALAASGIFGAIFVRRISLALSPATTALAVSA